MFIVRRQDMLNKRGGASYMVEASKDYGCKYRYAKVAKRLASTFKSKNTARRYANQTGGAVVAV